MLKISKIVLAFLFTLCFFEMSTAQDNEAARAVINIEASVIQSIELITVSNIRLRNFPTDQSEVYISAVNSVDAGHMVASGNPNADIRIEYQSERILTQANGSGVLRFSYEVSGNTVDVQGASELILNNNRDFRFNEQGLFYLWIGGRINIEQAQPGTYEGEFLIEIDYI